MEPKAGPPDDGGDQGAFTRPGDTLAQPSSPSEQVHGGGGPDQVTTGQGSLATWLLIPLGLMLLVVVGYCVVPSRPSSDASSLPARGAMHAEQ